MVTNFQTNLLRNWITTPVRSIEEASRHFIEVADTLLEEEGKTLVLNGLQTTPATLNIVPNAHGTWFPFARAM